MRATLMGAAGAFALAAVAFSGAADAQCFWTGLGDSCAAPPARAPVNATVYSYPAYPAAPAYYGYAPSYYYNGAGASSYAGPRASGH